MAKDNSARVRQAAQLARKHGRRAGYDRILIVTEGRKTEPLYFDEIRQHHKLHTANVQVQHGALGTQPLQVVDYAEQLFASGDANKRIRPGAFEQVYAVFDRDDHPTYHDALAKAAALNGRLKNDLGVAIKFEAIASVPCFELWLLLHFEDVLAPIHRADVYRRLDGYLPGYTKGQGGHFLATRAGLAAATQRASQLARRHEAQDGEQPFTDVHRLVSLLTGLKSG